jgi:hypothetical protein
MNYGLIISHKYPNADAADYTVVQEPGQQPQLTYWNEAALGPKPTDDQFRGWWIDAEKWERRKRVKIAASTEYRSLFLVDGEYDEIEHDDLREKKTLSKVPTAVALTTAQQATSTRMDEIKAKRLDLWKQVNAVTQQANETVEDAVARVRAVAW